MDFKSQVPAIRAGAGSVTNDAVSWNDRDARPGGWSAAPQQSPCLQKNADGPGAVRACRRRRRRWRRRWCGGSSSCGSSSCSARARQQPAAPPGLCALLRLGQQQQPATPQQPHKLRAHGCVDLLLLRVRCSTDRDSGPVLPCLDLLQPALHCLPALPPAWLLTSPPRSPTQPRACPPALPPTHLQAGGSRPATCWCAPMARPSCCPCPPPSPN